MTNAHAEPLVEIRDVAKAYGHVPLLTRVNLAVNAGELVVVYGEPATGKTVLMRLLMGLEQPTSGSLWLRGRDVTAVPAADRNIGYVPQSFALYPHISVHDNIAYPLKLAGMAKSEAEPIVQRAAAMLKIGDLLGKRPDQLSGGQKQRVAVARGIAKQTEIFVLDDPLAGLDFKLREQLVDDLKHLQVSTDATFIYTTSDAIEALTLADEIAILAAGRIVEAGPPERLYDAPARAETMALLGFPRANVLPGTLAARDGGLWCETAICSFPVRLAPGVAEWQGTDVTVGIRPESISLGSGPARNGHNVRLPAQVLLREDLGGEEIVYLETAGAALTTVVRHDARVDAILGETAVMLDPVDLVVFAPDGSRIGQGATGGHG